MGEAWPSSAVVRLIKGTLGRGIDLACDFLSRSVDPDPWWKMDFVLATSPFSSLSTTSTPSDDLVLSGVHHCFLAFLWWKLGPPSYSLAHDI